MQPLLLRPAPCFSNSLSRSTEERHARNDQYLFR